MGFLSLALIEAVLVGALSGLVGVLVVVRRRAFFATALTHSTFPGAVAAVVLGVAPALGAAVFSLALVGVMTALASIRRLGGQVASGLVLTSGFALGALLQALNPNLPIQIESFLVGSILTVNPADIWLTAAMLAIAVIVIAAFGKELLFSSFDGAAYRAAGYRMWLPELLSLVLIAGTVVVAMPAVGSILAIALIVGPAASARLWAPSIASMTVAAPLIGAATAVAGVLASTALGISAGGTISLIAAIVFVITLGARELGARTRLGTARRTQPARSAA
ncbi:metal ABC transporter permease [Salinibacterium sp. ZJ450]|uniref:metal ABC transporter permease n=1 Tax=Salinibacterium sp. ZJ450 TaxID=2708338 RepID=UPI001421861E|nr:metal ABC transporter permease [Salinibacterium sp. ZJ450]